MNLLNQYTTLGLFNVFHKNNSINKMIKKIILVRYARLLYPYKSEMFIFIFHVCNIIWRGDTSKWH